MKPIDARTLETVDMIAAALSQRGKIVVGNAEFAEALRAVVGAVRGYQRVSPEEERAAWMALFVGACAEPGTNVAQAARIADSRMVEYRERFGISR